jgi:S1-C subfamily serine protease
MAPQVGNGNFNSAESIPTQVFNNGSIDLVNQVPTDPLIAEAYSNLRQSVVRITNQMDPHSNPHPTEYGTGFIASSTGQVVTDLHVVQHAQSLSVQVGDKPYPAHIVRSSPDSDLALLQIDSPDKTQKFAPVDLAASSAMLRGERVGAFGYAEGSTQLSFASGTFSQRLQLAELLPYVNGGLMPGENAKRAIDESVLPAISGTSGGPLFKLDSTGHWRVAGIINMSDPRLHHADSTPVEAIWRLLGRQPELALAAPTMTNNTPLFGMVRPTRTAMPIFANRFSLTPNTVPPPETKPLPKAPGG